MSEAVIRDGEPDTTTACEYCSHVFVGEHSPSVSLPSATLYECPSCGRWTESR